MLPEHFPSIRKIKYLGDPAYKLPPDSRGANDLAAAKRRPSVLVVDDERYIADTLAEILTESGFRAVALHDGTSALEYVTKECPDLLICDVVMPDINGIEVAKAVTEHCSHTRVLLFSGQAQTTDLIERVRAAGHSFELLAKPVDPGKLLKKLRAMLDWKGE